MYNPGPHVYPCEKEIISDDYEGIDWIMRTDFVVCIFMHIYLALGRKQLEKALTLM